MRTPERSARPWIRVLIAGAVAAAAAIGVWVRFHGLSGLQLSFDEYYSLQSVRYILESGAPAFPSGGYYTRGLLLQYLTAASVWALGDGSLGHRLPTLLASLACVPLAFLYARRHLGQGLALAVAVILLLSSWQIEFARFARMYAPFQLALLFFLLCWERAYVEGRWHRRYLPHLAIVLLALTHSLAVLLVPFLFVPLWLPRVRESLNDAGSRARFAAAGVLATLPVLVLSRLKLRDFGVTDALPGDYSPPPLPALRLPSELLASPSGDPMRDLVLVAGVIAMGGGWLAWRHWKSVSSPAPDAIGAGERVARGTLLWTLMVACAFHQLALAGIAAACLALRYELLRPARNDRWVYGTVALAGLLACAWLAFALLSDAESASTSLRALRERFFGFPDLYRGLLVPWRQDLPVLGLLFLGAFGLEAVLRGRDPWHRLVREPVCILAYIGLCISVLRAPSLTTRYVFAFHPLLVILLAQAARDGLALVAARLPRLRLDYAFAPIALLLALYAASDDFLPRHLAGIASKDVAFRLGRFERFQPAWFWRFDFEGPADFLDRTSDRDAADPVILVNFPPVPPRGPQHIHPVSYYLDAEHAIYMPRSGGFWMLSRRSGSSELWSDNPLLSSCEQVRRYTAEAGTVWLVRHHDPLAPPGQSGAEADPECVGSFDAERAWGERLASSERVFLGEDGRVEVVRVELAPARPPQDAHLRSAGVSR